MIKDFFPVDAELKILIFLLDKSEEGLCQSDIAKGLDTSYSHVVKRMSLLSELGLIKPQSLGRMKLITLTASGRKCAKNLVKAREFFKGAVKK